MAVNIPPPYFSSIYGIRVVSIFLTQWDDESEKEEARMKKKNQGTLRIERVS